MSAVPQSAPDKTPGDVDREAGDKIHEERSDHENEAGNAPRHDPARAAPASTTDVLLGRAAARRPVHYLALA